MTHALHVDRLTKHYGPAVALGGVSLTVPRGRFVTLLGPSGSGKTTLLMAIAGFVAPDGGTIRLDGRDITRTPPDKRNFGMVFQGYALFPHMTVADNVAFPLKIRRVPRAEITRRVTTALDQVQMGHLGHRMPRQLSGGQQQRAALARAMVFQPDLLLLDEPLSALDRNLRLDMQTELKDLHERVGLTFIYVTHDQQEALSMSDEIAILRDGKLIQQDAPQALYERPATRFVADFLGRSNFLAGRVEARDSTGFTYRCGAHLLVQAGPGPAVGEPVLVTVRPEKLSLGAGNANRLHGRVAAASYLGDTTQLRVDVDGVGRLTVLQPTWRGQPAPHGATVDIGWDYDASIPVTDDIGAA